MCCPVLRSAHWERKRRRKALALDPNLAEAHAYLGAVKLWYDWDWPGAEREIRRALELNANSSNAHDAFGDYLETLGRMQEGMIEHQRAQELDPAGDSL